MKRTAIYLRVSTIDQTTANQERELRQVAERAGWDVVQVYKDHGVSGAKGRDKRPAFGRPRLDPRTRAGIRTALRLATSGCGPLPRSLALPSKPCAAACQSPFDRPKSLSVVSFYRRI